MVTSFFPNIKAHRKYLSVLTIVLGFISIGSLHGVTFQWNQQIIKTELAASTKKGKTSFYHYRLAFNELHKKILSLKVKAELHKQNGLELANKVETNLKSRRLIKGTITNRLQKKLLPSQIYPDELPS